MADDQAEVIAFLEAPATHGGTPPEHVETHGAHVFLAGDTALKIKRAVAYDYMDFSTLSSRERMLRRELELNRPFAPQIYRDVLPVTRDAGGLRLGGEGPVVEWVLRMHRFRAEDELSTIAARGGVSDGLAGELGRVIARYHRDAPIRNADGAQLIAAILDELDHVFAGMHDALGADRVKRFSRDIRDAFDSRADDLGMRGQDGHVRRCHGDLHLRNIVLIDGRPVLFDALEFDETLGTCDVLYDLAFLLMDLRHGGFDRAANIVLNAWTFEADGAEDAGLSCLPLFLAVRAAIRAMVTVQSDTATHHEGQSTEEARAYLDDALAAIAPPAPRLIALGGLSGTGKTTVARDLAPGIGAAPGAVHLRSDLARKRLAGVPPGTHLPDSAYTAAAGRAVCQRLLDRAEALIAAGHSVVLDATWLDPDDRARVEALARRKGVPFTGLWLEAPEEVLTARVAARRGDASDADARVVAMQEVRDAGTVEWARIDASGEVGAVSAAARAALRRAAS